MYTIAFEAIMSNEKISIKNFGGMTSLEVELRQINIFIGPQASGKSITVKLLFFFKNILSDIIESISDGEDKRIFKNEQLKKFNAYFPKESCGESPFSISYYLDESIGISINRDAKGKLKLDFTKKLDSVIVYLKNIYRKFQEQSPLKEDDYFFRNRLLKQELQQNLYHLLSKDEQKFCGRQIFIPAGRSFYANLQANIFSFLSANKTLDPFLIEFGSIYENFKHILNRRTSRILKQDNKEEKRHNEIEKIISDILRSSYQRENDKDYLIHLDKRKVNLANASSGQQEILPLLIILETLLKNRVSFGTETVTFFIEEPEAHLFPIAQNKVIKLLARLCNNEKSRYQLFITTHSPYVLASFNNLLLAGNIINKNDKNKSSKVFEHIQSSEIISIDKISAYSLSNGECNDIIDLESNLIDAKILDSVSEDISTEFDRLLDIEFDAEA